MTENNPDHTGDIPEIGVLLGDHKDNELFADVKDVGSLANMIIDNSKTLGENKTTIEELQGGQPVVPESADDYAYEVVEGDTPLGDDDLTALKAFAHENKWTADQFAQSLQIRNTLANQAVEAHNTKVEEDLTSLKKEMGDDFEPGQDLVKKVLSVFGSEDLVKRTDLVSDPDVYKLVLAFGKVISPDVLEKMGVGAGSKMFSGKSTADTLFDKTPSS